MIEQFSKEDFENYLTSTHSPFNSLGLVDGEYTYELPLDNQVSIIVRSSVKSNGLSADVGKDSIRCWLVSGDKPLGSKVSKWTTRQAGWQDNLSCHIKQLVLWRALAGDCKECRRPKGIFKARTEANKGRPFAKCREHNGFVWLDEPIKSSDIYFSEESHDKTEAKAVEISKEKVHQSNEKEKVIQKRSSAVFFPTEKKSPNNQQKQAIESTINANLRVLAGPGSGKTFVIEHRYKFMVENGIDPSKIVVCTFGKQAATDMGQRILATCPQANLEQICTIHALCYRLLAKWYPDSRWYKWTGPKDWQIKKALEDITGPIWQESEKPSAQEVYNYINTSKYLGLTTDDSYLWFVDVLGQRYGAWLYEIRSKFDAWLNRNKFLTFADQLFLVEQQLKNDSDFRTMVQDRFSHIIVDEGQDTNAQALRILLTIAQPNTILLVGDTDQMMYRFQGAESELMLDELEQWISDIETVKLEINYRSQDEIISKSQQLISHNYSALGGPYPQEFAKSMTGVKGQGDKIKFAMYKTADEEALAVAQTINELVSKNRCCACDGKGYRFYNENDKIPEGEEDQEVDCENCNGLGYFQSYNFGDFFIGARTRAQLGYVEGALVRAGIKFINIAGGSFWQSRHVLDVVSYLRLAHDTRNKEALEQVYNIPSAQHKYTWDDNKKNPEKGRFRAGDYCPTRYLGKEFLAKINYQFDNIDKVLLGKNGWRYQTKAKDYDIYGPTKAQDLQEFVWMLRGLLDQADDMGQVIRTIIDDCYEKYLRNNDTIGDEGLVNAKLEDLATVGDLASQFNSPELFLAYVDENIQAAEDAKNRDWEGYTILSTYHRLKGLERPIVFGLGWCEGENTKTGEAVGLLPHTFSLSSPPDFGVLPSGGMSPIEDERCIGYVCVTRAEEKVYLSGIETYRTWQMWPSRFINEMEIEND